MQRADYQRLKAYPLTPEDRRWLAQLKQTDRLAFFRARARLYRQASRDRALADMGYQLVLDQWHRQQVQCQYCTKTWAWPVNRRFRIAHREICQPHRFPSWFFRRPPSPVRLPTDPP